MKEHPILFSGPMVKVILDGRKTQTRRIVKPQPSVIAGMWHQRGERDLFYDAKQPHLWHFTSPSGKENIVTPLNCPYGQLADRLWVRETWRGEQGNVEYRADTHNHGPVDGKADSESSNWRPSIFMPRSLSRITLEIADVRVERLQDISTSDACAEGVGGCRDDLGNVHAVPMFHALWDAINKQRGYGWDTNPWVWVLTFKRVEK